MIILTDEQILEAVRIGKTIVGDLTQKTRGAIAVVLARQGHTGCLQVAQASFIRVHNALDHFLNPPASEANKIEGPLAWDFSLKGKNGLACFQGQVLSQHVVLSTELVMEVLGAIFENSGMSGDDA